MANSRWPLFFQAISTVSIVTLAGLAIYRETRNGGSLLGRDQLGLPEPAHRLRAKRLSAEARDVRRSFDHALSSGRCDHALDQLVAVSKYEGAIGAHRGRDVEPPSDFELLRRYTAHCGAGSRRV